MSLSETEKKQLDDQIKETEHTGNEAVATTFQEFMKAFEQALGEAVKSDDGTAIAKSTDNCQVAGFASQFMSWFDKLELRSPQKLS